MMDICCRPEELKDTELKRQTQTITSSILRKEVKMSTDTCTMLIGAETDNWVEISSVGLIRSLTGQLVCEKKQQKTNSTCRGRNQVRKHHQRKVSFQTRVTCSFRFYTDGKASTDYQLNASLCKLSQHDHTHFAGFSHF